MSAVGNTKDADTMRAASHYWRVRVRVPERFGQRCRVLAYGRLNACLVEFEDWTRVLTCRYYVRKLKQ